MSNRLAVIVFAIDMSSNSSNWMWIWLLVALALGVLEVVVAGGTLAVLPWALSAILAAILALVGVPFVWQLVAFGVVGFVLFFPMFRWARRISAVHTHLPGVGAQRLVGMTGLVVGEISSPDPGWAGKVALEGEIWAATSTHGQTIPTDATVIVRAMQGTRAVVEQVTQQSAPSRPLSPPTSGHHQPPSADPSTGQ